MKEIAVSFIMQHPVVTMYIIWLICGTIFESVKEICRATVKIAEIFNDTVAIASGIKKRDKREPIGFKCAKEES
jgi:hypothetical protein